MVLLRQGAVSGGDETMRRSEQFAERLAVDVEQTLIGAKGGAVGKTGEPVADQTGPGAFVVLPFNWAGNFSGEELQVVFGRTLDVTFLQCIKQTFENGAGLEVELVKLGGVEDQFDGDAFVQFGAGPFVFVDDQLPLMAAGEGAEMIVGGSEAAGPDVLTDATAEPGFHPLITHGLEQELEVFRLDGVEGLVGGPGFEFLKGDEAGLNGISEVVDGIGGVVGPVHDLAFDAAEIIAGLPWGEMGGEGLVVEDKI